MRANAGIASARKLSETLKKNGSSLVGIEQNLVDLVWGKERPARPIEKVKVHPDKYAGKSFQDKISELRKELENKKKGGFIICTGFMKTLPLRKNADGQRSYA